MSDLSEKTIEDVAQGDVVLALENGKLVHSAVTEVHPPRLAKVLQLEFASGKKTVCTPEHLYKLSSKGDPVQAISITHAISLAHAYSIGQVQKLQKDPVEGRVMLGHQMVYNFATEHGYYFANGHYVKNCDSLYSPADGGGKKAPRKEIEISQLILALESPRVVVTGGEPFVQKNMPALVQAILESGRDVSIETSGAIWQEVPAQAWVTLSPKQHVSPQYPVNEKMWRRANEIKIVVCDGTELEFYRPYLEDLSCPIYLQPEWFNKESTIPLVMIQIQSGWSKQRGVKLSLQSHKYLGLL